MRWARRHWLEIGLAVLLALPWLSLFGLGLLWLWQNGRVLEWALAAAVLGLLGWPLRILARRRAQARIAGLLGGDFPEAGWNAEEREAWAKVLRFAAETPSLGFDDRAEIEALTWKTMELVATHFHPAEPDPMAHVTLPEALLLTEQVSQRLRRWVIQWPGAGRIRISQALRLQGLVERHGPTFRAVYGIGDKLWRAARFTLNPVQAVVQEAQRLTAGAGLDALGGNMRQRATRQIVEETGRAAIDLYSGRLRLSSTELAELARADAAAATPEAPPRLLLVGQAGAGKTSLLNALAGVARGHVSAVPGDGLVREHLVEVEGRSALNIADMPPLADPKRFLAEAERADMILWVASATQPGRAPDAAALEALRGWAGGQRRNRPPPVLLALTHCDRLRPAAEWSPPYDPERPSGAKALSMRAARDAVAELLSLPPESVIPVALPEGQAAWNVDSLWNRLSGELNSARLARHERLLEAGSALSWRSEARKTLSTGRGFLKSMFRRG